MVRIYALSETTRDIAMRLYAHLKPWALFDESHAILVAQREDSTSLSYWTARSQQTENQTKFNVQIIGTTCDVLDFDIMDEYRRMGYGRALYKALEKFAIEYGCTKMQTAPSGQGIKFWPKMGFNTPCKIGLEKSLS